MLSAEFVGEGVQSTILDANRRLIRRNGKMLPESGDIRIALLGDSSEINENLFAGNVDGFDLSKFNAITSNKFSINLKEKPRLLSETKVAFKFNLYGYEELAKKEAILNLTVQESGLCHGVIQWLGVKIFKHIKYENKPGELGSHWPTPIYLFDEPIEVFKGQVLKIKATLFEDNLWFLHQQ